MSLAAASSAPHLWPTDWSPDTRFVLFACGPLTEYKNSGFWELVGYEFIRLPARVRTVGPIDGVRRLGPHEAQEPPSQIAKYHSDLGSCTLRSVVSRLLRLSQHEINPMNLQGEPDHQKLRIQKRGTLDGKNFETYCTKARQGTRAAGETATERSSAVRIQRTQSQRWFEKQ